MLPGALLSPAPSARQGEELRVQTVPGRAGLRAAVLGAGEGCWGCWGWGRELAVPWVSKKGAETQGAGDLPGNCLARSIRSKWGAHKGWGKERGAKGVASKRSRVWDRAGAAKSPAGLHPAERAGTQQRSSHRYGNKARGRASGRGAARTRPRALHRAGRRWGGQGGHHRRAASRGRERSEASRGRGSTQPGAPGPCPALPLSRAGRRGPHGSRRRDRAAAGGAAGAARAPRQTHPEDGGDRLLLRGPRCGWMVQGAGPARPGGHESRGREEDGPGPGRVCTMLPRMLPRHHRGRERSVCGGKLVQDPAGLRGCPAHQLLYLATGADCQLLLRPSEPQAGGCPVRGHCLELLPLLESKSGVRGEAVSRGCPRSLSAS